MLYGRNYFPFTKNHRLLKVKTNRGRNKKRTKNIIKKEWGNLSSLLFNNEIYPAKLPGDPMC